MILDEILRKGLERIKESDESLRIDNIIVGKSIYSMKNCKSVFSDMNMCLVLLENAYGFSYFQEKLDCEYFCRFIDMPLPDVLDLNIEPYFKVAIVDSIYCLLNNSESKKYKYFTGNLREKANQRAVELTKDIPKKSKVVLIGAVTEIIEQAVKRELDLTVVDLAPQKLILEIEGIKVMGGSNGATLEALRNADYAIVSGMVLSTDTLDSIMKVAKENGVKIIFFMETGSNVGEELLNHGAYKVLSEYFPYYDFYGDTRYEVLSKD